MGLFGFGKKKEAKSSIPPQDMDVRHIDDLDLPPLPSDKDIDTSNIPLPHESAADTSKNEGKPIPEALPPIEDVPSYEDEFLPLPAYKDESMETMKPASPVQMMPRPEMAQQPQRMVPQMPAQQETKPEPFSFEAQQMQRHTNVINNQFMKLSNYRELLDEITTMKVGLTNASKTMTRIKQVKNPEDSEFNRWKETLEDIERKILYIDKTIFG